MARAGLQIGLARRGLNLLNTLGNWPDQRRRWRTGKACSQSHLASVCLGPTRVKCLNGRPSSWAEWNFGRRLGVFLCGRTASLQSVGARSERESKVRRPRKQSFPRSQTGNSPLTSCRRPPIEPELCQLSRRSLDLAPTKLQLCGAVSRVLRRRSSSSTEEMSLSSEIGRDQARTPSEGRPSLWPNQAPLGSKREQA